MKITPAMLDKDAVKAVAQRAELGLMNVEEAVCGYLDALLASGKASVGFGDAAGTPPTWTAPVARGLRLAISPSS